ncbi:MAG: DNA polymerase III subunit alpha [Polaribacter sp.]|jgi:DNA polymerase-3 subunit alpha|uniref:DNA polymerase III subunit alpha n=1 Tax=Polaribacter sp. TaxID=1920175 RepID=UPI0026250755|nr:DNA polymerase III subunit alpha [Polaribacter sp.]MBT3742452.1 DNA polymerase III subunit alpha [Polaribacter sp.]MDG1195406.1 DNA polymerase III subunit alpha [Polaribacter sp.]MDG1403681.1 DNA polymerase III subunit alpha [Polaribacter sp.]MDG2437408.1 DNA polymerase III subunit alpha [Polaribacter sp.]
MYINCHSYYSLRYGTFSEIELLQLAVANNIKTIALTDINNTSACLNFIQQAKKHAIKPVVGVDFRNGNTQQFVAIAKNNTGFKNINSYLSSFLETKTIIPDIPTYLDEVFIIYPFEKALELNLTSFAENEFIGVSIAEINKLRFSYLKKYEDKIVIQQQVTIRNKRDFNAHRLLRAIANNTLLSKLPKTEECLVTDTMHTATSLQEYFKEFTFIIANTKALLQSCSISFGYDIDRKNQNLQLYCNSFKEDYESLVRLCNNNIYKRYPNPTQKVHARLQKELKVIVKLKFVSFFLINYDIIHYAKKNNFFHVGRGSGANSIVAYIIGITDVDPIELDLYFERFINPFRASPPDFDIDFSWKDRNTVTQYIFNRFDNVALLATYNTFKYRAIVRELGKVFGLPKEEIDKLSKGGAQSKLDELSKLVLKYGKLIEGFPNYVSVHSAGILILDKPIHYYSATSLPPKGFATVQFDMNIADDVGVFKFDILGQRGLAKIKDALQIIKENNPDAPEIDITDVESFKKDKNINNLLKTGGAIGAYYVESPAMRGLMQKLQTQDYLGLVAASSIIRPGVSGSGMKEEFIKRHRFPEKRKEAHPILLEIMPETYGIMVYQEDVMKVANKFADLTLGEADVLRRGMSGKYRSVKEFKAVEDKFISNCRKKGHEDKLIFEVWNQIKSFAGYAFAKGHSASYAVESYQSLFLKCYYPIEFMTAVLNNGGGFYSTEHYIHEAKMCGATIALPCINKSDHANRIKEKTIYLGFGYLKNLEHLLVQRFLTERQLYGPFLSLDNFIDRIAISIEQLSVLIRIDAFRFTKKPKTKLLWEATFKLHKTKTQKVEQQVKLFRLQHQNFEIPKLNSHWLENVYDEIALLGFTIHNYFSLVTEAFLPHIKAKEMALFTNQNVLLYGQLVATRFNKTSQGKLMRLSTFIDADGNYFDAVHFTDVVQLYPINGMGIYGCYGKITNRFGFCSMNVLTSKKMSIASDPRC